MEDYQYWAFISYSHEDSEWGKWLHNHLETTKLPAKLVAQPSRFGPIPKRLYPVFRDREELSAGYELGAPIESALNQSRTLIVICSPRSARSRWVEKEIQYFLSLGRARDIHAFIVDGAPNISNGIEPVAKECFPAGLRGLNVEPLAADARLQGDGRRNAYLKLVAGILGISYDKLRERDAERRNRALVKVIAASIVLVIVMATLTTFSIIGRRQALEAQTDLLVRSAFNNADNSDGKAAVEDLIGALEIDPENITAKTRLATLLTQRIFPLQIEGRRPSFSGKLWKIHSSHDHATLVLLSDKREIEIFEPDKKIQWPDGLNAFPVKEVAFSGNDSILALMGEKGQISVWDIASQRLKNEIREKHPCSTLAISNSGKWIASCWLWLLSDGSVEKKMEIPQKEKIKDLYFSGNDEYLFVVYENGKVVKITLRSIVLTEIKNLNQNVTVTAVSDSSNLLAIGNNFGHITVINLATNESYYAFDMGSSITSMMFDQNRLYVAGLNGETKSWDSQKRQVVSSEKVHDGAIVSLKKNQTRQLTASWDGSARLSSEGMPTYEPMRHDGSVFDAAPGHKMDEVYTAGADGLVRYWRYPKTDFRYNSLNLDIDVEQLAHDQMFGLLVARSREGEKAVLWYRGEQQNLPTESPLVNIAVSPEGDRIVGLTAKGLMVSWSIADTGAHKDHSIQLTEAPRRIFSVADWDTLVMQYDDNRFRLWDLKSGRPVGLMMEAKSTLDHVVPMRDLSLILAIDNIGNVFFWDYLSGLPVEYKQVLPIEANRLIYRYGYLLAVSGENITVYDVVESGRLIGKPVIKQVAILKHNDEVSSAAVIQTTKGVVVLTGSVDGILKVWATPFSQKPLVKVAMGSSISALDISSNGLHILVGTQDGRLKVVNFRGDSIADGIHLKAPLVYARFDSQGNSVLAVSATGEARVFETGLNKVSHWPTWLLTGAATYVETRPSAVDFGDIGVEENPWAAWYRGLIEQYIKDSE